MGASLHIRIADTVFRQSTTLGNQKSAGTLVLISCCCGHRGGGPSCSLESMRNPSRVVKLRFWCTWLWLALWHSLFAECGFPVLVGALLRFLLRSTDADRCRPITFVPARSFPDRFLLGVVLCSLAHVLASHSQDMRRS